MGELSDWTKENSQFFKLEDGESATVVFKGFEFAKSTFDPDRPIVRYTLKTPHGAKLWDSSAQGIAKFFDTIKSGQTIKITRIGTGTDTKYKLALVEGSEEVPEPEETEEV